VFVSSFSIRDGLRPSVIAPGSGPVARRRHVLFITFFQEKIFHFLIVFFSIKHYMDGDRIDKLISQVHRLTIQVQGLERAIRRTEDLSASSTTHTDFFAFATGDRVRILNSVKKPARWDNNKVWHEREAKYATVVRIQGGRVYIVTDNGISTWRSAHNLRDANRDE
jgi:hypothetical protein